MLHSRTRWQWAFAGGVLGFVLLMGAPASAMTIKPAGLVQQAAQGSAVHVHYRHYKRHYHGRRHLSRRYHYRHHPKRHVHRYYKYKKYGRHRKYRHSFGFTIRIH